MSFFVGRNDNYLDRMTDADTLMRAAPGYYGPRFDAIKELRDSDDGTLHKGNEFRRVASLVNVPLLAAMRLCEPEFLKDKRKFYSWLDKHPEYCSYQRPSRLGRADQTRRDLGTLGETIVVPVTEAPEIIP